MNSIDRLASQIDTLAVPQFDVSGVHARAAKLRVPKRRRAIIAIALLAVLVPALAAAAVYYLPVRIERRPNGNLHVYAYAVQAWFRPTASTFHDIARKVPYPVVLPAEIPHSAKLRSALLASSQVVFLNYTCGHGGYVRFIIVPKNARVRGDGPSTWPTRRAAIHYWDAGVESVRLDTTCLTTHEIMRVRSQMIAAGKLQR